MLSDFSPSGVEHSAPFVGQVVNRLMLSDFSPSGVEHRMGLADQCGRAICFQISRLRALSTLVAFLAFFLFTECFQISRLRALSTRGNVHHRRCCRYAFRFLAFGR